MPTTYLTIKIDASDDQTNPSEDGDGQWQLYDFDQKAKRHKPQEEFFKPVYSDESNIYRPTSFQAANIGLWQKLKVGLAFPVQYSEHGICAYEMLGNQSGLDLNVSKIDGIIVWEEPSENMGAKTYPERYIDGMHFLEDYTDWANGSKYEWTIEIEDEDGKQQTFDNSGQPIHRGTPAQIDSWYSHDQDEMLAEIRRVVTDLIVEKGLNPDEIEYSDEGYRLFSSHEFEPTAEELVAARDLYKKELVAIS